MRTILFLLQKEFLQIFRNRIMLVLIFLVPVIQLLVLSNAADFEIRNISLHVIDHDQSAASRRLTGKFAASPHFNLVDFSFSRDKALRNLENDDVDLILEIPVSFEKELMREQHGKVDLSINAINGVKAGLSYGYAGAILRDFGADWTLERTGQPAMPGGMQVEYAYWFNPDLNYYTFMVPGILVMLVTLIGMFLSGMNIVKEKEIGTIEQINVTPIRKYQFIVGKLLPFWVIGLVELAIGLTIGKFVFDIPIAGSLGLVFGFAAVYLLVVLGMGLLVSTLTETQQQAMFLAYFFLIIFVLLSGLFTPIESMPVWAQKLTWFNPIAYFVEVMRLVLLKGSGFFAIRNHFFILALFALIINALAVLNYRKTTG